jgi:hypothetical protein
MGAITMRGTEQLTSLAQRFREAANSGLRDELRKTLSTMGPGIIDSVRNSARTTLPRRGGLAALIADRSVFTAPVVTTPTEVRLSVTARSEVNIKLLDDGTVRHPLFGNRQHWYTEAVRPGWFTRPLQGLGPKVAEELNQTLETVARKIEGK